MLIELNDFQLQRYVSRYERLRQARETLEQQKAAYQQSLEEPASAPTKTPKAILSLGQWRAIRQEADLDAGWRQHTEQEISRLGARQERLAELEQRLLRRLAYLGLPCEIYVGLPYPSPTGPESAILLQHGLDNAGKDSNEKEHDIMSHEPENHYSLELVLSEAIDKAPVAATHKEVRRVSDQIKGYRNSSPGERLSVWAKPLPDFLFYVLITLVSWGLLSAGFDTTLTLSGYSGDTVDLATLTPLDAAVRDIAADPMSNTFALLSQEAQTDPKSLQYPISVLTEIITTTVSATILIGAPVLMLAAYATRLVLTPFVAAKHLRTTHNIVSYRSYNYRRP